MEGFEAMSDVISSGRFLAVVGASEIGAGIAHVSLDKDLQVILHDPMSDALVRGQSQIRRGYQNAIQRNRITQ
jgi:enoyl-CoA hydratase/long-chain 3-hydroxyacyl-CoA dehydrogenase